MLRCVALSALLSIDQYNCVTYFKRYIYSYTVVVVVALMFRRKKKRTEKKIPPPHCKCYAITSTSLVFKCLYSKHFISTSFIDFFLLAHLQRISTPMFNGINLNLVASFYMLNVNLNDLNFHFKNKFIMINNNSNRATNREEKNWS